MAVYLVTYDLVAPGRDYTALRQRLQAYAHCKALESVWLLDTPSSAVQVREHLRGAMDANDRLLVAALAGETAWTSLLLGAAEWLVSRFGRG